MGLFDQAAPYIGGILRWLTDETSCARYPVGDRAVSIGKGGATPFRALVNDGLPASKLFWTTAAAASVKSTTDETSIVGTKAGPNFPGASAAGTFPAGYLNRIGAGLRVVSVGTVKTNGTPDLTIKAKLDTAAIFDSANKALESTAAAMPYRFEFNGFVVTTGATGTILGQGHFVYTPGGVTAVLISAAMSAVTVDLTAALPFGLTATWGASDANNDIIGHHTYVEYW